MVKVSDTAPKMAISLAPASTYRCDKEEIMAERKNITKKLGNSASPSHY
jgi:hypothetical protein